MAATENSPMFMGEDDFGDVALPAEMCVPFLDADTDSHSDDEYITRDSYLSQPPDKPSIMTGFCYISRLFECAFKRPVI